MSSAPGRPQGALPGTKIAVIAITPLINNTPDEGSDVLGATLADLISKRLAQSGNGRVLERQDIDKVLGELRLKRAGAETQDYALQAGKILGANLMGFGSYSSIGGKMAVSVRFVKVETGEILGGVNETVVDMAKLNKSAEKIADKAAIIIKGLK